MALSKLEEQFDGQLYTVGIRDYVREFPFAPPRRYRADFAWPDAKLLVEIEGGTYMGGRHVSPIGYEKDAEKYNLATLLGFRVLRFTGKMVKDGRALTAVQTALGVRA